MNWILRVLDREIKRFKTADPFEIASGRHIVIRYFPLGDTFGFYMKNARHQVITINSDIEDFKKLYTCCHELGHAVLHPNENTPFLNQNTIRSRGKIETQAHYWATMEVLKYRQSRPEYYETRNLLLRENGIPYEMAKFF
ncbi:ImmA/IrrE family metallo-endopeptidase [Sporolactobacillus shoreicorticis]|uniref:ImmA/IrrE family metallo-endopeptidase n=1 Tax=Sporolactobacillus shoreicorticis TaxID=1923877 RepID=A0ABW5RYN0_9BACL|nr:ImmA/IrrE family metallo-endopeptidase [Sporolactobacillus shoreicorticis]MCO7125076.1 ImmA/IrrE family metallo-endopeptidase [Sporolactobacillus shoreicorticis]